MENELLLRTVSYLSIAKKISLLRAAGIICLLFLVTTGVHAQTTIRSARSGDWHVATTWVGGKVPGSADVVELYDGHQVTLTAQATCSRIELFPPHNSSSLVKTEFIVGSGASLAATTIVLNPKNDRRYTSFVNNGGAVSASSFVIGNGCITENLAGTIAVTTDVVNHGDIIMGAATLEIGGNYTFGGKSTFSEGTSTVKYTGSNTATQIIAPLPYHHLQLAGSSTKVPAASLLVSGDLLIESSATLNAGTYAHTVSGNVVNYGTLASEPNVATSLTVGGDYTNYGTTAAGAATYSIAGDWANNGTFQEGISTIILQGNTLQQLSGVTTFYNMHFRGSAQALLHNDITIRNSTSITNSHFNTGQNQVWLGTNAALTSPETDAAHIIGTVKTSRTLTPQAAESFGNIGLTLTRNEVDPGVITVERLTGVTTEISDGTESITRQYNISRSGMNDITALDMTMDLTFLPSELKSKPLNEYKLYNKGRNSEVMPVQSTAVSQTTMRHTNSNRFGTYTLAPPVIVPLPVELVWFKAQKQAHTVVLQWKTASEQDNKGFEIQVSTDGKTYQAIDFIESRTGNSNVPQFYTYTDSNPARNTVLHYRLRQVDFSGKYSFSKPMAVSAFTSGLIVQAVPNPFTDSIRFAGDSNAMQVTLTDMSGRPVLQQTLLPQQRSADGYHQLSTAQVQQAGLYVLTIKTQDQTQQTKLLKQ
ncbi:T9SS type A sorting domain-containing protein [Pontibacter sp. Tf4]|uniref:T9SS type A sorting domain-containing protein n=1 Tax=Pontibacter sp. Tf4 TaxID=2761620 RepID=UPI00162847DC|nr:T9SS type A sorting domain-containing protein [Pontibacter sp. Tf4]MBB6611532.1 T9SS type A sorting domain-containing protein [Pontibacter sp. Tf4]